MPPRGEDEEEASFQEERGGSHEKREAPIPLLMTYLPRRERLATWRLAVTNADSVKSWRFTFWGQWSPTTTTQKLFRKNYEANEGNFKTIQGKKKLGIGRAFRSNIIHCT